MPLQVIEESIYPRSSFHERATFIISGAGIDYVGNTISNPVHRHFSLD